MKSSRLSPIICLILFAQLAGCAFAATGKCGSPEKNQADCMKERSEIRRRAIPDNRAPPQPLPPASPHTSLSRQPIVPPPTVPPPTVPAKPAGPPPVTTSCDAGGCWDSGANRYHGGAGNIYLDNSGKPCHRIGTSMQCF